MPATIRIKVTLSMFSLWRGTQAQSKDDLFDRDSAEKQAILYRSGHIEQKDICSGNETSVGVRGNRRALPAN